MESKLLIPFIISIALLLCSLYFYLFTRKINVMNELIFYLYYAEQFDFNDQDNVKRFSIVLERFLEPHINRKVIGNLILENPKDNNISVSYDIKYLLSRSHMIFDLVKSSS